MSAELIGFIIGIVLTLMVYSYLIKDSLISQIAIHLLVGVSAGYTTLVLINQFIRPTLDIEIIHEVDPTWVVPILILFLLWLTRKRLGDGTVAFWIGIGASLALVGASLGTLLPQLLAFSNTENAVLNLVVALLTISVLMTFQFTSRSEVGRFSLPRAQTAVKQLGKAVLMMTFGALFAAILNTSLFLLADRFQTFISGWPG